MKILIIFSVSCLLFISNLYASPNPNIQMQYSQPTEQQNPLALLKNGIKQLSSFISQGGAKNPRALTHFLKEQIAPFFDFDEMSYLVAGKHYRNMNANTKQAFQNKLKKMFFLALSKHLQGYSRQTPQFDFIRPIQDGKNRVLAKVRILRSNIRPTLLTFVLMKGNKGWKVLDVSINGQSAILYYRKNYLKQMHRLSRPQY